MTTNESQRQRPLYVRWKPGMMMMLNFLIINNCLIINNQFKRRKSFFGLPEKGAV